MTNECKFVVVLWDINTTSSCFVSPPFIKKICLSTLFSLFSQFVASQKFFILPHCVCRTKSFYKLQTCICTCAGGRCCRNLHPGQLWKEWYISALTIFEWIQWKVCSFRDQKVQSWAESAHHCNLQIELLLITLQLTQHVNVGLIHQPPKAKITTWDLGACVCQDSIKPCPVTAPKSSPNPILPATSWLYAGTRRDAGEQEQEAAAMFIQPAGRGGTNNSNDTEGYAARRSIRAKVGRKKIQR